MMLYVVFMIIFARSDEAKLRARLSCGKETDFTRCVAGDREQKKGAAAGAFDIEAKTLVGFFVEQRVGLGCAENVAIEAVGALRGFVFDGVEEAAIIGGPGGAGDTLDSDWERFAAVQILDLQRVLAEAGGVERIGEQAIVVADRERAEAQKRMARGERV